MNPNDRKYFDELKGCTLNMTCSMPECTEKIWVQEGIGTSYNGKKYLHNRTDKVMSVVTELGPVCNECWEDLFKVGI